MKSTPNSNSVTFAALLRGINVGGNKLIKMDALKKVFESLRFDNVTTILASGNVIFEAPQTTADALVKTIEEQLKKTFKSEIGVLIRSIGELQNLAKSEPFKEIKVTPQTRLYVTFLSEKSKTSLKIPYRSPDGNFKIIRATKSEVCSVATLTPDSRTVDLMGILEKEYGKKVTTRNWNTIERILKAGKELAR